MAIRTVRWKDFKIARERMVREQLIDRGIRNKRVLEAMLKVPRHIFLDREAGAEAYSDHSFPIGFSQTMTQPYMVAYLAEKLMLRGSERVLELGTGSGYQAAVLGMLTKEVFTIERVPALASKASRALHELLYANVKMRVGDGSAGWPEQGPFDRVLITAATSHVPQKLLMQLCEGGIFLGPVKKDDGTQEIVRLTRKGHNFLLKRLIECSFVPMVSESAVPRDAALEASPDAATQGEPYGG